MGYIVIKPDRYRDEYVYWSTIVEAPIAYGSRAEMLELLIEEAVGSDSPSDPPEVRMERADRLGSSAVGAAAGTPRWPAGYTEGHWGDDTFIYEQRGYLPRARLFEAARLIDQDREPEVWDLMAPFEDELEVRRG